jgi:hypothetical protein
MSGGSVVDEAFQTSVMEYSPPSRTAARGGVFSGGGGSTGGAWYRGDRPSGSRLVSQYRLGLKSSGLGSIVIGTVASALVAPLAASAMRTTVSEPSSRPTRAERHASRSALSTR